MKQQELGRSHLPVTPIGLGLAALGRPGYINLGHADDLENNHDVKVMEVRAHAVLTAAWDAGIRYFDTARSYGKAEFFLQSWLQTNNIPQNSITIGSKWGYTYTADWQVQVKEGEKHEIKEHSLPVLQRQIQESRKLLGNHLDLYQIHSTSIESGALDNIPVLTELAHLRNKGLAIGFSVTGTGQAETIQRALEIEFDGVLLFSAVQASWNVLEQSVTPALRMAYDAGMGVIVKEGLANGRLSTRNTNPGFHKQMTLLQTLAKKQNSTVDALALAAVLNQPFVDVVLSGAASVEHLQSNLQALQIKWNASLADSLQELVEPTTDYWHTRSQLAWN
jgi:aryl-alcohol dehydrogenase-like predicted oxidoreductase